MAVKSKRQIANAMRKAAKFFDEHPDQWVRGTSATTVDNIGTMGYCAIGRCNVELGLSPFVTSYERGFTYPKVNSLAIPVFNDSEAETAADVSKALRQVAGELDHGLKLVWYKENGEEYVRVVK